MKTERFLFSSVIVGFLIISMIIPVHANVQSVKTDRQYYVGDATIVFTGTIEDEDNGLVTIVINDPTGEFVMLTQGYPNEDNTFEIKVSTESKFSSQGTYNATAFVVNMTGGSSVLFDYYLSQASVPQSLKNPSPPPVVNEEDDSTPVSDESPVQENETQVEENSNVGDVEAEQKEEEPQVQDAGEKTTAGIVYPDPDKDPQHYIDRYNNEPLYREWFNKNFLGKTIYEVVGVKEPVENEKNVAKSPIVEDAKKKPIAENKSEESSNSIEKEFTQILFALGGIGVLFGAVYGIKRKVDSNSNQIIKNRQQIAKSISKQHDEPIEILKTRLARGEIDLRQYNKIRNALENN